MKHGRIVRVTSLRCGTHLHSNYTDSITLRNDAAVLQRPLRHLSMRTPNRTRHEGCTNRSGDAGTKQHERFIRPIHEWHPIKRFMFNR